MATGVFTHFTDGANKEIQNWISRVVSGAVHGYYYTT